MVYSMALSTGQLMYCLTNCKFIGINGMDSSTNWVSLHEPDSPKQLVNWNPLEVALEDRCELNSLTQYYTSWEEAFQD